MTSTLLQLKAEIQWYLDASFNDNKKQMAMDVLDNIYRRDLVDLYPNLALAMRLILTLPVSVATGEKSF